jgi:serine/threonine-protein kinase
LLKVADFGLATTAQRTRALAHIASDADVVAYAPPELLRGGAVDARSDLYSLAVVGYHLLSGETPFKAANTPAMLVKHVSERPRPIRERRPEIPAYLAVAIDRALAKRPEDRWVDAAEFRDALDAAQNSRRAGGIRRRRFQPRRVTRSFPPARSPAPYRAAGGSQS